ncbi:hypothetical protein AJ87_08360 [Rhizobium yanglingense]|nr:hypothetical protein AJ87_08360 [Rhizobium yanglingense]
MQQSFHRTLKAEARLTRNPISWLHGKGDVFSIGFAARATGFAERTMRTEEFRAIDERCRGEVGHALAEENGVIGAMAAPC